MTLLKPGDVVSAVFTVERELGQGGMGTVYLATHTNLYRKVALKVPHPEFLKDPAMRARLEREARLMARLTHENIAAVHDMRWDADSGFIAMEYVEGRSLTQCLRDLPPGSVSLGDALELGEQIASALDYLHREGVAHRDLKPTNIMVEYASQRVKLLDFGLARSIAQGDDDIFRTRAGGGSGTPGYMAPEQTVASHDASPAVDIYSFGVVLYRMLARSLPWKGCGRELVRAQVIQPPAPIHERNHHIPRSVSALFAACLGAPKERPDDARSFCAMVANALGPDLLARPYDEVVPAHLESEPEESSPRSASGKPVPRLAGNSTAPPPPAPRPSPILEPTEPEGSPVFDQDVIQDAMDKLFG